METLEIDTVVIGAGVVGLAVARELALAGQQGIVLEQRGHFGEGISSRNSEVIHGGLHYPRESLKARLCVQGRELLYDYCQRHPVGHRRTGKWVIASDDSQLEQLAQVQDAAAANGVELQAADKAQLGRQLPGVSAVAGLFSPSTGIVSSHDLMVSLLGELEAAGGQLVCHAPVEEAASTGHGHRLLVGGSDPCQLQCQRVVNAAGLQALDLGLAGVELRLQGGVLSDALVDLLVELGRKPAVPRDPARPGARAGSVQDLGCLIVPMACLTVRF